MGFRSGTAAVVAVATMLALTASAQVSDSEQAAQDRIRELERKVDVLTDEIGRLRTEVAVPEEPAPLESWRGLGPAASRIYGIARGLSIGGYAEVYYRALVDDKKSSQSNTTDALRTVLYVGYKFTDSIIFNSEIEFEHGSTSSNLDGQSGSASVELAQLDFLWKDWMNFRGGLLLAPVGFINEVHEPPFFHGVQRPEVETQIIPTTWRENGLGFFGNYGETLEFRAYVMNGLDGRGASSSNLRSTRAKGNRARADDLAGVLRVDWTPTLDLLLGGSVYVGGFDQNRPDYPDSILTLWEVHAEYEWRGLELRGLFSMAHISNAGDLTLALRADPDAKIGGTDQTIAEEMLGFYVEAAYDIGGWLFPERGWYLAPFFRYEYYDTQHDTPSGPLFSSDSTKQRSVFQPGISFKPHPNVVLKLDYRDFDQDDGRKADEVQIGMGLAF